MTALLATGSRVVAVSSSPLHGFSKQPQPSIRLLAGKGVDGDAHCGRTTQHLYRKRRDPAQPNLTQVHLVGSELLRHFSEAGYEVLPGDFGENILTSGLDLLELPLGTRLAIGREALVQVTGLRTPCSQIDGFQNGLQGLCWSERDRDGKRSRRAGIMSIVLENGLVKAGDSIRVELPKRPYRPLPPV